MKFIFIIICSLTSLSLLAHPIKIYEVYSRGIKFQHFSFTLTPENTILPGSKNAPKCYPEHLSCHYRDVCLDEYSKNFNYGQFDIYKHQIDLSKKVFFKHASIRFKFDF